MHRNKHVCIYLYIKREKAREMEIGIERERERKRGGGGLTRSGIRRPTGCRPLTPRGRTRNPRSMTHTSPAERREKNQWFE